MKPTAHRGHPAFWAFVVHRVSGIALALFLPAHFYVLGLALEQSQFAETIAWTAAIREGIHPIMAWVFSARGTVESPLQFVRMNLEWHPSRFHPWILRTGFALKEDNDFEPRAELVLLARTRWRIPHSPHHSLPGLHPLSRAPAWPLIGNFGPNELTTIGADSTEDKAFERALKRK